MVAIELGVDLDFQPVFDLTSCDATDYGGNPALKIPVLVDERGALFGTENICRALARRVSQPPRIVMAREVDDRVVANAEELTLHVMAAEVSLVMAKAVGDPASRPAWSEKTWASLRGGLAFLDATIDAAMKALPSDRTTSFLEVALYCLVEHLRFRDVIDVAPFVHLDAHCAKVGARASAQETTYRFDVR